MNPQFQDPIKKREEFAVSLRKEKAKDLIQSKRKKIAESFFSQKPNLLDQNDQIENPRFNELGSYNGYFQSP